MFYSAGRPLPVQWRSLRELKVAIFPILLIPASHDEIGPTRILSKAGCMQNFAFMGRFFAKAVSSCGIWEERPLSLLVVLWLLVSVVDPRHNFLSEGGSNLCQRKAEKAMAIRDQSWTPTGSSTSWERIVVRVENECRYIEKKWPITVEYKCNTTIQYELRSF